MTDPSNRNGPKSGYSRRDFLRGSSAAAAAAALATREAAAQEKEDTPVFSGSTTITLNVNGEQKEVRVEPRTTLLEALRYQLDLTGAKPVSIDGTCGASTVWVDGRLVSAATILAIACVGKKVKTVESLDGDEPDPVCKAFTEHDAQQCGFCTPGFVVAVRAFLDRHPNATEEQVRAGLNGNICRCGTYADVIKAALSVAKGG